MNINRNNYEEWFLMYVDNELTTTDREAVEKFVQQHKDLQPELEMLQQAVLIPEPNISFDKTSLYKTENAGINISNYEEYFVLYVDNELNATDKAAVETFVLQHPALQNEFTAFKETVLAPETIEFGNKEILFRKEPARVIAFEWKRLSVAAAVLGIIATGIWFSNDSNETAPLATTEVSEQKNAVIKENKVAPSTSVPAEEVVVKESAIASTQKQISPDNKSLAGTTVTKQPTDRNTINTVIENDPSKAIAYVAEDVINKTKEPIASELNNNSTNGKGVTIAEQDPVETIVAQTKSEAVAYRELEEESTNDNIGIGPLSVNKDKLKGIFRKAGRLLTSKTRNENEDGKLQVANLEIDTRKLK